MAYVLWEATGGNRIAEFPTREEALDALRTKLAEHSNAEEGSWLLWYEDGQGDLHTIATGASLIAMARAARPQQQLAAEGERT